MRRSNLCTLWLLFLLAGCDSQPEPPRDAKKFSPDAGYLQTTVEAREVSREQIYEVEANRAVEMFRARNGRLPKSLAELQPPLKTLPSPRKYVYDAKTGKVVVK